MDAAHSHEEELAALMARLEIALEEVARALEAARHGRWRAPDPFVLAIGQAVVAVGRFLLITEHDRRALQGTERLG